MKICLVCASGGHLTEMLSLKNAFDSHDVFLVTYKEKFRNFPKNIKRIYFIPNILVDRVQVNRAKKMLLIILQLLISAGKELRILLNERPDVVISTGSEIAIPICYLAKIFNKKVIFIESLCRINDLSGTGKIVSPISDIFLVQWDTLIGKCKKAQYHGNVLQAHFNLDQSYELDKESFIFVTVGTAHFPRLVEKMDEISKMLDLKVIMQIGKTNYKPKNTEYFDFLDNEKFRELIKRAKIVISHAGVGSIMTILEEGKPLLLVPRLKKYGESIDDHQIEITRELEMVGWIKAVYDVEMLDVMLKNSSINSNANYAELKKDDDLSIALSEYISRLS